MDRRSLLTGAVAVAGAAALPVPADAGWQTFEVDITREEFIRLLNESRVEARASYPLKPMGIKQCVVHARPEQGENGEVVSVPDAYAMFATYTDGTVQEFELTEAKRGLVFLRMEAAAIVHNRTGQKPKMAEILEYEAPRRRALVEQFGKDVYGGKLGWLA